MVRLVASALFGKFVVLLDERDPELSAALRADLRYLTLHGRDAGLPTVRHRIQTSEHYPAMSEVRTRTGTTGPVLRTLVVFDSDNVAVCGDKSRAGNAWYERAVPAADEMYAKWKEQQQ